MLSLGNQVKTVYLYFNLYKENESGYYFKVDFYVFLPVNQRPWTSGVDLEHSKTPQSSSW